MRTARRLVFSVALGMSVLAMDSSADRVVSFPQARAEEDWRREFDDVCSKTQDAMALSLEELRSLVVRCDKLKPRLETLGESHRKVFTRRLQACRDLYQFVLESRESR